MVVESPVGDGKLAIWDKNFALRVMLCGSLSRLIGGVVGGVGM